MDDDGLLGVLDDAAAAVRLALEGLSDWGPAGTRPGQSRSVQHRQRRRVGREVEAVLARAGARGTPVGQPLEREAHRRRGVVQHAEQAVLVHRVTNPTGDSPAEASLGLSRLSASWQQ